MKITITHTDGHKQVETAFNSVAECQKALFSQVPAGVIFETDEPVVAYLSEPTIEVLARHQRSLRRPRPNDT